MNSFEQMEAVIAQRRAEPQEGSYTCYLFEKGIDKILERRKRGHQVVIDLDARKALYGIHGLQGIAVHQRVVDFARLARQHRVARDRH